MVSTRVLHYGIDDLFWECLTSSKRESNMIEHTLSDQSAEWQDEGFKRSLFTSSEHHITREDGLRKWYRIVRQYSGLSLTRKEDKLPALSGIASRIEDIIKDNYLAGVWKNDLHNGLLWFRDGPAEASQTYRAPSWSWACLDGPVDLIFSSTTERTGSIFDAEIVDTRIACAKQDRFGIVQEAAITISALTKNVFYRGSRGVAPYDDDELDLIIDILDETGLRIGTGYLDHLDEIAKAQPISQDLPTAPSLLAEGYREGKAIWISERKEKTDANTHIVIYFLLVVPTSPNKWLQRDCFKRIGIGHTQDLFSKEILGDGAFYDCEAREIDLV
jgi:hypothetical protein